MKLLKYEINMALENNILIEKESDIIEIEYGNLFNIDTSAALIETEHEDFSNLDTSQVFVSVKIWLDWLFKW